jgi:hypothetical protein
MESQNCPYRADCHFYYIEKKTSSDEVLKGIFCLKGHERCEIYRRRSEGKSVPKGLWPDG